MLCRVEGLLRCFVTRNGDVCMLGRNALFCCLFMLCDTCMLLSKRSGSIFACGRMLEVLGGGEKIHFVSSSHTDTIEFTPGSVIAQ